MESLMIVCVCVSPECHNRDVTVDAQTDASCLSEVSC